MSDQLSSTSRHTIPKKKLLVILGAGSSIPLALPSVADLDKAMQDWSAQWSSRHGLPNYFHAAWRAAETHYGVAASGIHPTTNFETVLGAALALAHWLTPPPFGSALRELVGYTAVVPTLWFPAGEYGGEIAVIDQLTTLFVSLARHVRNLCLTTDVGANASFKSYRDLLDLLCTTFDVGIFNLNYDNAALVARPDLFTGFLTTGIFDPYAVHSRDDWGFLYHLHGSIHHSFDGPFGSIRWQHDLSATFNDGNPGRSTDIRSDNRAFPERP